MTGIGEEVLLREDDVQEVRTRRLELASYLMGRDLPSDRGARILGLHWGRLVLREVFFQGVPGIRPVPYLALVQRVVCSNSLGEAGPHWCYTLPFLL